MVGMPRQKFSVCGHRFIFFVLSEPRDVTEGFEMPLIDSFLKGWVVLHNSRRLQQVIQSMAGIDAEERGRKNVNTCNFMAYLSYYYANIFLTLV